MKKTTKTKQAQTPTPFQGAVPTPFELPRIGKLGKATAQLLSQGESIAAIASRMEAHPAEIIEAAELMLDSMRSAEEKRWQQLQLLGAVQPALDLATIRVIRCKMLRHGQLNGILPLTEPLPPNPLPKS